ncbi:Trehalose import ATP-binding protein SugC [compost metagenome]
MRSYLATQLRGLGLPTLVVTHDPEDAILLGDQIAVLEGGVIVQRGTWAELKAQPTSRFVEELVRTG